MSTINQLTAMDTLTGSDLIPVYSQYNGDARKASMSVLAAFVQSTFETTGDKVTQYAAPTASAITIQVSNTSDSVWLIVTPSSVFAAGTIKLPAVANCIDRQELLVNYVNGVTALTIDGNGATNVIGAPTTMANNAFFRLRFDMVVKTWYRVG